MAPNQPKSTNEDASMKFLLTWNAEGGVKDCFWEVNISTNRFPGALHHNPVPPPGDVGRRSGASGLAGNLVLTSCTQRLVLSQKTDAHGRHCRQTSVTRVTCPLKTRIILLILERWITGSCVNSPSVHVLDQLQKIWVYWDAGRFPV